jgi:hypothetical protein
VLVTILLFKIKVVLCVITHHHHRHRFEKKIIRSEREVNAEIDILRDDGGTHLLGKTNISRCRKKKTRRQKHHHLKRKKERMRKKE